MPYHWSPSGREALKKKVGWQSDMLHCAVEDVWKPGDEIL